mgnify:CR=1 FL=1
MLHEILTFKYLHIIIKTQITYAGKYVKPDLHWDAGSIVGDLDTLSNKVGRKKYLEEFIKNKEEIYKGLTIKILSLNLKLRLFNTSSKDMAQ